MKRNLTVTTAAAALLIGTVFAVAQGVQRPGAEPGGGAQMAPQQDGGKGKAQPQQQPRTQGQGGQPQAQGAPEGKGKTQSKDPGTQGQSEQGQRETQTQPQQQPKQQQGQQTPRGDTQKTQKGAEGKAGGSGGVTLTTQQRTTIRNTVLKSGPRVTNVNFSINVGTVVPRERVKLVAVPPTLVEIHPAWRGYVYFIVDERIIIVEPSSYKIVAVLVV
jgi:hypothetical protein